MAEFGNVSAQTFLGVIGRPVIHDNDFADRIALRQNALNRSDNKCTAIICGNKC